MNKRSSTCVTMNIAGQLNSGLDIGEAAEGVNDEVQVCKCATEREGDRRR